MKASFSSSYSYVLIYVFAIDDEQHSGCLKVGKATVKIADSSEYSLLKKPCSSKLNAAAKRRIDSYTKTAGVSYHLHYTELAEKKICLEDGVERVEYFEDHQVHDVLLNSGVKKANFGGSKEWFLTDLETVKKAIQAVKEGRSVLTGSEVSQGKTPIIFRPEQLDAMNMTINRFKRGNKMLWNAKMRFGKTLCALEVIRREQFVKSIIITHRPVVDEGWHDDFNKIFWNQDYVYCSKGTDETVVQQYLNEQKSFVYFACVSSTPNGQKNMSNLDKIIRA